MKDNSRFSFFSLIGLLLILLFHAENTVNAIEPKVSKTSFTGTVKDKKTAEPLIGVTIYFPDLKTGTVTDENGAFKIDNLPSSNVLVQVSYLGYSTIIQHINLVVEEEYHFQMEYTATELNEVVVTGNSMAQDQKHTPAPVAIVPKIVLLQSASTNIIDAIALQPGISQITTGSGISKPVIRGLGFNRVIVVNDGIRQEGQQWGDEHGIEIDEYTINSVEIIKGPSCLAYGSDAMAGVISMLSAPMLPKGSVNGNFTSNFQSNNGLLGVSVNAAANNNGLVTDLRMSTKVAHAYENKADGFVYNSGYNEKAFLGTIGLNKTWGFSHITINGYFLTPGMVEGERDSLSGHFIKPIIEKDGNVSNTITDNSDHYTYSLKVPYQKVEHFKLVSNSNIIIGDGNFKSTIGFQQNNRREFADITNPNTYGLFLKLNSYSGDIRYSFPEVFAISISAGISGMVQQSLNKGSEFLVPDYNLANGGIFALVQKNTGKLDITGGIRFDSRAEEGFSLYLNKDGTRALLATPNYVQKFHSFKTSFLGTSASIGVTWQITEKVFTKLNFSRGYRAPNIAELASNGIHEGTLRYELGNDKLAAETSFQIDYTFGFNLEHISAELNLFDNEIDNFVYSRKLASITGNDSANENLPVFKFVSGKAHLYGGEMRFDLHPHPLDWIHFENSFSYVRAIQRNQPDSSRNLPQTPAPRIISTLRLELRHNWQFFQHAFIQLSNEKNFAQMFYYKAFATETATPAYNLINLGLGTDIEIHGKTRCSNL